METVSVKTLKGFNNGGQYVGRGRAIQVEESRARDLERNGLVQRQEKNAPPPSNKMAADPENKRRGRKNEPAPTE